jgi:hypothetical protein
MTETKYDNTNRGVLFDNRPKKREGRKDPDFRGSANLYGADYWVSAWIRSNKDGTMRVELAFTPKESPPVASTVGNVAIANDPFLAPSVARVIPMVAPVDEPAFNDEIPF